MKVQAMPVPVQARSETADMRQANVPKEDFLSILKKRTEDTADKTAGNSRNPVKKADKKEEKRPETKDTSQELKEAGALNDLIQAEPKDGMNSEEEETAKAGTKSGTNSETAATEDLQVSEGIGLQEAGRSGLLAEEIILKNAAGRNAVSEISEGAKRLYRQSAILGGSELSNKDQLKGSLADLPNAAEILSGQEESVKEPSTALFAEALQNKAGLAKEGLQIKHAGPGMDLQPEIVKTAETGAGTQSGEGSGMDSSGKENQDLVRWFSLNRSSGGEKSLLGMEDAGKAGQDAGAVSLEELQKKAEQSAFLPFERLVGGKLSGGAMTQVMDNRGVTDATPLPDQLRTGIEQGLSRQLNQFTIRLKPEGLGEILVHMTSTGGKIGLSIGVSNLETQKLLSSEMMHLKETMQPLNAEVQEIYHNSQGGMEMMNYEQGFLKNRQGDTAGTAHRSLTGMDAEEEDGDAVDMPEAVKRYTDLGRLSAYI